MQNLLQRDRSLKSLFNDDFDYNRNSNNYSNNDNNDYRNYNDENK